MTKVWAAEVSRIPPASLPDPITIDMASTSKLADVQDEEWAERIKSKFKEELA